MAVAALVDPDILAFEPMHVAVEVTGTHTAGMTLCDGRRLGPDFRPIPTSLPRAEGCGPECRRRGGGGGGALHPWELFQDVLAT